MDPISLVILNNQLQVHNRNPILGIMQRQWIKSVKLHTLLRWNLFLCKLVFVSKSVHASYLKIVDNEAQPCAAFATQLKNVKCISKVSILPEPEH